MTRPKLGGDYDFRLGVCMPWRQRKEERFCKKTLRQRKKRKEMHRY